MGAEQVLKSAHRPLTTEEIVSRVKDKNRNSVFSEIRTLTKYKLIVKIELKISTNGTYPGQGIVFYHWIG